METIEKAIEAAYEADITALYRALSQSIFTASGNEAEIGSAEHRFKRGLAFAADVRARARAAAGL
jgi:hypothetical protein